MVDIIIIYFIKKVTKGGERIKENDGGDELNYDIL
jgi:hypothetical protein